MANIVNTLKALSRKFVMGSQDAEPFTTSQQYWRRRYELGGNSGAGSYGKLADYKADVLNRFVREQSITSVVEFGFGDGNQLALSNYPNYMGYDVSPDCVDDCQRKFSDDPTKQFALVDEYASAQFDLALSLDVIYHVVEDAAYQTYMNNLFSSAERFVIIYSSNVDEPSTVPHVLHRKFTRWVKENAQAWTLLQRLSNPHAIDPNFQENLQADFYIYQHAT